MALAYEDINGVVKKIQGGRVATYGQIAAITGVPGQPRQVGYALNALRGPRFLPWHRVINAKGEIRTRTRLGCEIVQQVLLEREGIEFDAQGRVELARFG